MKPSEELHHISLLFQQYKDDNDWLLKFVENLRKATIAYLKKIIPTDVDLTNYWQADYYCSEIRNNPEHTPYRNAAQILSTCNHALRTGKVNQDHIRVIVGSWGGIDKAEEIQEIIHEERRNNAKLSGGRKPDPYILEAVIKFIQQRPRKRTSVKETNEGIANVFCKECNINKKMEGTSAGIEWEVYYTENRIYSAKRKVGAKTPKTVINSIVKSVLRNAYIPKAKEAISTDNSK